MRRICTNILDGIYWKETQVSFSCLTEEKEWNIIRIYPENTYQMWHGFGGAFTESTCYNMHLLDLNKYQQILRDYFGEEGLQYNLGHIAIGSCDFSLGSHSYALEKDKQFIIPTIKDAMQYRSLKLMASPWSPPGK